MKRQVALNMGYELVDRRLELFGKKIKNNSCLFNFFDFKVTSCIIKNDYQFLKNIKWKRKIKL